MEYERIVIQRLGDPPCPAAALVAESTGGTGCACRITASLIDSRHDPATLARYCFNAAGYQQCPTWRAEREEYLRNRRIRPLLNSRGDLTAGHPEDRERDRGMALALDAQERAAWEQQREPSR